MKALNKYIALAILILSLTTSCEDFLDNKAFSDISKEDFYKNINDYEKALTGCYYMISGRGPVKEGNFTFGTIMMGECGTDEMWTNYNKGANFESSVQLDLYTSLSASNIICQEIWLNHYKGIAATNEIISRISLMDEEMLKNTPRYLEIRAEASFLQALWYFNLVRTFGGVPIVTKPAEGSDNLATMKRNSVKDVYTHILDLLEFSKDNLPETIAQYGRSRKISAYSLSAKVNLHIASSMNLLSKTISNESIKLNGINSFEWNEGELTQTETIKKYYKQAKEDADFALKSYSGSHKGNYLMPKYTDCFYPNESSDEILFEAIASSDLAYEMGGWLGSIYGPLGRSMNGGGQHVLFMNQAIVMDTYGFTFKGTAGVPDYTITKDKRFTWTIATFSLQNLPAKEITVANSYKQFEIGKFRIDSPAPYNQDRTPVNNPILRMSEVCLIFAEALAEYNNIDNPGSEVPSEALDFINAVRTRAGLNDYLYGTSDDVQNGKTDYKNIISYDDLNIIGNKEIKGYDKTIAYDNGSPIGHFRRAILNERILELCGEGHRWYDLVRMGVFNPVLDAVTTYTLSVPNITVHGVNASGDPIKQVNVVRKRPLDFPRRIIKDFHIFRPLPEREISLHAGNLIQNYGY